jgi:hypothetical protein
MSGVLTNRCGRKKSFASVRRQFGEVVGQFALAVAPGEVGIALRESDLRQPLHHGRPRESLGQKNHFGRARPDIGNQPLPERHRLGVRIVDAKDPDALIHPPLHHVAQREPQRRLGIVGIEVEIDDVLVFLGWILGEAYRAVAAPAEPAGMLVSQG